MRKKIHLLSFAFVCFLAACSKKSTPDGPTIIPAVSIAKINLPSFANSTWVQVTGGKVAVEYRLKDAKDSVSTVIKDSIDLKNMSSYHKELAKGTYDIVIKSKNLSNAADTFMRFNTTIKSVNIEDQKALDVSATSNDGLITLGKSFVKDGLVPTFKTDTGTRNYKFGLSNGFYYLYVKKGLQGTVSFTSKTGEQLVGKKIVMDKPTQYNMALATNSAGGFDVVFTAFTYNQVAVSSATLLNMTINPDRMVGYTVYFLATDETGAILNETKYITGTTSMKLVSQTPFEKERFNFYMIKISDRSDTKPAGVGYLQIRKGSTYVDQPGTQSPVVTQPLNIHLKNVTQFDKLQLSTDRSYYELVSATDPDGIKSLSYSDNSKVWVQVLKNNTVTYNFFDITKGTHDYDIDVTKCDKPSLVKEITAPGNNLQVAVYGKNDVTPKYQYDHDWDYSLGYSRSQYNHLPYYYPVEPFKQYVTTMSYSLNNFEYFIISLGTSIPDRADTFNASFDVAGLSMASFKPSCTGAFDFYTANFDNAVNTPNFYFTVYSPSAAKPVDIKFPDFSKYLKIDKLDMSNMKLRSFFLYQMDDYDETKLEYTYGYNQMYMNSKSISKNYY